GGRLSDCQWRDRGSVPPPGQRSHGARRYALDRLRSAGDAGLAKRLFEWPMGGISELSHRVGNTKALSAPGSGRADLQYGLIAGDWLRPIPTRRRISSFPTPSSRACWRLRFLLEPRHSSLMVDGAVACRRAEHRRSELLSSVGHSRLCSYHLVKSVAGVHV